MSDGAGLHENEATASSKQSAEADQSNRGGPCRMRFKGAFVSKENDASSHQVAPASA
jgi:hypothetical protein